MYYLVKCEDGNTFQVILDEDELRVVAYSNMDVRPLKFKTVSEKIGDDTWLAPNIMYRAAPEKTNYFVRYLDDIGIVQETRVLDMVQYRHPAEADSLTIESGHHKVDHVLYVPNHALRYEDARELMKSVSRKSNHQEIFITFRDTSQVSVAFLEELAELICEKQSVKTWYIKNTSLEPSNAGYTAKSVLDAYIKTYRPDNATFSVVWTDKIGKEKR